MPVFQIYRIIQSYSVKIYNVLEIPACYNIDFIYCCCCNKIICILREKKDSYPDDNGIWIASHSEHHESLKKLIPVLRKIEMFGENAGDWLLIPADDENFESYANTFCSLVLQGDLRIGKISKAKFLRG